MSDKRVIAIISRPQECGEHQIHFLSTETGKIIDIVSIDGFYDMGCLRPVTRELGEPIEVYQMYGGTMDVRNERIGTTINGNVYIDEECTKLFSAPKRKRKGNDVPTYTIKDMEYIKTVPDKDLPNILQCQVYKCKIVEVEHTYEYDQDYDNFYHSFKKELGIKLSYYNRCNMDLEKDIVPMIAKKKGFEVINTLYY